MSRHDATARHEQSRQPQPPQSQPQYDSRPSAGRSGPPPARPEPEYAGNESASYPVGSDDSRGGGSGRDRPAHVVRIGTIQGAIWVSQYQAENGSSVRFRVTLNKRYLHENKWRDSNSLNRDDLLVAAKVLDQCHSWIVFQGNQSPG